MFVCEPCHSKPGYGCTGAWIEGVFRSRGKCELCGEVANCLDCHGYKYVDPGNPMDDRINPGYKQPEASVAVEWPDPDMEKALTEDSRIDPNPGGEEATVKWMEFAEGEKVTVRFLDQPEDYVTCGAFLSMMHPVRVKTRATECSTLIPVKDLPCACPSCGQWKSA